MAAMGNHLGIWDDMGDGCHYLHELLIHWAPKRPAPRIVKA